MMGGGGPPGPTPVPRYKLAVIIWLALYPALTLTLVVIGPLIAEWPVFLRTLVATVILVPAMVYVLVPTMQRLFAGWLRPGPSS